jgi:putative membrane protein
VPWYWDDGWWGGWVMMSGMVIFWVAVVVLIVWALHAWGGGARQVAAPPPHLQAPAPSHWTAAEDAVAVVKRRYAAGEIDRDEYLQKLSDLGAPPPARS